MYRESQRSEFDFLVHIDSNAWAEVPVSITCADNGTKGVYTGTIAASGWVAEDTITVTFDSEATVITAASTADIAGKKAAVASGALDADNIVSILKNAPKLSAAFDIAKGSATTVVFTQKTAGTGVSPTVAKSSTSGTFTIATTTSGAANTQAAYNLTPGTPISVSGWGSDGVRVGKPTVSGSTESTFFGFVVLPACVHVGETAQIAVCHGRALVKTEFLPAKDAAGGAYDWGTTSGSIGAYMRATNQFQTLKTTEGVRYTV